MLAFFTLNISNYQRNSIETEHEIVKKNNINDSCNL